MRRALLECRRCGNKITLDPFVPGGPRLGECPGKCGNDFEYSYDGGKGIEMEGPHTDWIIRPLAHGGSGRLGAPIKDVIAHKKYKGDYPTKEQEWLATFDDERRLH